MTRLVHVVPEQLRVEVTFFGPVNFADRVEAIKEVEPRVGELGLKGVLIDYSQAWWTNQHCAHFRNSKIAFAHVIG